MSLFVGLDMSIIITSDGTIISRILSSQNTIRLNDFDIGLIELNETELSDFGFTLIGGRMPVTSNEVAITKYIFEHFENFVILIIPLVFT